jgi:hypothetical protein
MNTNVSMYAMLLDSNYAFGVIISLNRVFLYMGMVGYKLPDFIFIKRV